MSIYELLRSAESLCKLLERNNVRIGDVRYLQMYDDWVRLKSEGHKYEFIIHYLSTQYDVSPSTVERIARRLSKELNV